MNDKFGTGDSLGQKLIALREGKGYSQEELAELLSVSRQTISNWENDKVKIDVSKAAEICRLFDVSMDELFLLRETAVRNEKSRSKTKFRLLCAGLLVAVIVMIAAMILFALGDKETSSVIYLGESAVWGILALVCALLCIVISIAIYRGFRK